MKNNNKDRLLFALNLVTLLMQIQVHGYLFHNRFLLLFALNLVTLLMQIQSCLLRKLQGLSCYLL